MPWEHHRHFRGTKSEGNFFTINSVFHDDRYDQRSNPEKCLAYYLARRIELIWVRL